MALDYKKLQDLYVEKLNSILPQLVVSLSNPKLKHTLKKQQWLHAGVDRQANPKMHPYEYGAELLFTSGTFIFKKVCLHISLSSGDTGNDCLAYGVSDALTPAVKEIIEKMVLELRKEVSPDFKLKI